MYLNQFKANDQLLLEGNFSAYIKRLYELGVVLQKDFVRDVNNCAEGMFADETDNKKKFNKYVVNHITEALCNFPPGQLSKESLCTKLWNLQSLLTVWEDPGLRHQDRKQRQAIKFKGDIDKSFRQAIRAALMAEVVRIHRAAHGFLVGKKLAPIDFEAKCLTECLADCILELKSETPKDINQTFDKAAKALSSFTPTADKFLHGFAMSIGLLAALAIGLAAGGFIFLFLSGLGAPLVVAGLAGLAIFTANTYANYGLFSVHCSKFLRALATNGGITEVIDQQGERRQLSMRMKCLLVLGAVFSVGVGLSNASLTIMFGMALLTTLFPALPVVLPAVLISTLVIGIGLGLSLLMFKAWVYLVDLMQTKFSSGREFLAWFIKEIKAFKNLTITQLLSYLLQVVFTGFALFGLFFICFTGIPSLVPALTLTGSWIVGFAAFLGDLPFTVITVLNFCSGFKQLFSQIDLNTTPAIEEPVSAANKKPLLARVTHGVLLTANAAGRSIQVFDGKLISAFAAVACFFSALAGTLSKSDNHEENSRNKANQTNKRLLIQDGYKISDSSNLTASENMQRNSSNSSFGEFFSSTPAFSLSSVPVAELNFSVRNSC